MDKESILKILDKMLTLWKNPVGVGFSKTNPGVTVLYETIEKTEKLYNKLPENIKEMTVFAPKAERHFYDVEKFENEAVRNNDDLLIDKDASLSDIMPNLIKAKSRYEKRSYFRDQWWGSPLNLQGQIKFVLENLKPKVMKEYSYRSEKEITLGGKKIRRKSYKKKRKTKKRLKREKRKRTSQKKTLIK